jgi:ATP-dependent Zn protease
LRVIKTMAQRLGLKFLDLDAARAHARKLVQQNRASIEVVATELLRRRRMTGAEVAALLPDIRTATLWVA